jgi:hypothetical protein
VRRQQTIRINQGYKVDSPWEALALGGRAIRYCAAAAWRYRTELNLVATVLLVRVLTGWYLSGGPAWAVTGSVAVALLLWPRSRRWVLGRLGCARTRRRLLACMAETRVATSAGRLPLVLRSRVTPAGERLTFGVFPGQSAELLDARVEELRAAAHARDVMVTRDLGRADRVVIDVIRRDALAGPALPSPLLAYAAALHDSSDAVPAAVPVPATDAGTSDLAKEATR